MKKPLLSILLLAAAAMVLIVLFRGDKEAPTTVETPEDPATEPAIIDAGDAMQDAEIGVAPVAKGELPAGARVVEGVIPDERFTRLADGRSLSNEGYAIGRTIHAPELTPEEDLDQIDLLLGLYRWAYREVPEGGENYEIMAGLTGENPHRVVFFPPNHGSFDGEGNLLDRWGTAYHFHKISDQEIDIVSAGPDRRLWTDDDLSLGHTEDYASTEND